MLLFVNGNQGILFLARSLKEFVFKVYDMFLNIITSKDNELDLKQVRYIYENITEVAESSLFKAKKLVSYGSTKIKEAAKNITFKQ